MGRLESVVSVAVLLLSPPSSADFSQLMEPDLELGRAFFSAFPLPSRDASLFPPPSAADDRPWEGGWGGGGEGERLCRLSLSSGELDLRRTPLPREEEGGV